MGSPLLTSALHHIVEQENGRCPLRPKADIAHCVIGKNNVLQRRGMLSALGSNILLAALLSRISSRRRHISARRRSLL
jgi:hypothetical protein